jgi:hypothetical protein
MSVRCSKVVIPLWLGQLSRSARSRRETPQHAGHTSVCVFNAAHITPDLTFQYHVRGYAVQAFDYNQRRLF